MAKIIRLLRVGDRLLRRKEAEDYHNRLFEILFTSVVQEQLLENKSLKDEMKQKGFTIKGWMDVVMRNSTWRQRLEFVAEINKAYFKLCDSLQKQIHEEPSDAHGSK